MIPLPIFRREKKRLIYDPSTRELRTHNGKFLKRVECPLEKSWDDMLCIEPFDKRSRYCGSCNRFVQDFTNVPEWRIRWRLFVAPDACVHFAATARNIVIQASSDSILSSGHCPYRIIPEASTDEEKRLATKCAIRFASGTEYTRGLFLLPNDLQIGEKVELSLAMGTFYGRERDGVTPNWADVLMRLQVTWDGEAFRMPEDKPTSGFLDWLGRQCMIG